MHKKTVQHSTKVATNYINTKHKKSHSEINPEWPYIIAFRIKVPNTRSQILYYTKSKRSKFITLVHALTKSLTNLTLESLIA